MALAYVFWLLRWSLGPDHFFFADDWDWLYRAALLTLREQFSLLPRYAMNDRPVGALAIRIFYRAFGLNPAPYHGLCLALHLLNITLLVALACRLMRSWWVAAATALAYGTWSGAIEGATWVADIFDVLGTTWILAIALTFASRRASVRWLSVALFYLALRTKEAAIVTPGLLTVLMMVSHPRREWRREATRTLWPHALLAAIFVAAYVPLIATHQTTGDVNNPYRMVFSPWTFFDGLYFYVSRMLYGRPWPVGRLIRWVVAMGALGFGVRWRSRATLVGLAGFVLFLLPVVFMAHQRQALYLYIPGAFFALALGGAADAAGARLRMPEAVSAAMMLLCVVALPHRANMAAHSEWLLDHTARARTDLDTFRARIPSLRPGARIALIGFPDDYNVFRTPGCSVLKVVYHVDPVSCVFTDDSAGADVVVVYRGEEIAVRPGGG